MILKTLMVISKTYLSSFENSFGHSFDLILSKSVSIISWGCEWQWWRLWSKSGRWRWWAQLQWSSLSSVIVMTLTGWWSWWWFSASLRQYETFWGVFNKGWINLTMRKLLILVILWFLQRKCFGDILASIHNCLEVVWLVLMSQKNGFDTNNYFVLSSCFQHDWLI